MGKILLKVNQDRDLYVEWSSIVDAPTYIGTRAEILDYLMGEIPSGYDPRPGDSPENRLARADIYGTSALFPEPPPYDGAWDDSGFIVKQRGWLPRADLGRFIDALIAGDEDAAYAVLQPFED